MGGQGRCERRSEVFVKIQKKRLGGRVGGGGGGRVWRGIRMDVNEESKFSVNNLFSLYFVYLYYLFISRFGFKSGICLLIAPVPVHCFSITFVKIKKMGGGSGRGGQGSGLEGLG